MGAIKSKNGQVVTEEMIKSWSDALDHDEWPEGWTNIGDVVDGMPPIDNRCSEPLTVKVTKAMKEALTVEAQKEGLSTSDAIREAITNWLLNKSA